MSLNDVRKACGGIEFPGQESVKHGGFQFAVDDKRSAAITVGDWLPKSSQKIDILCSRELIVLSFYDEKGQVIHVTRIPKAPSRR